MDCCLMAPSHYLNHCWLIISKVLWHSPEGNFIDVPRYVSLILSLKITNSRLWQGSFCVCTQPMRDAVTMYRHLSLAYTKWSLLWPYLPGASELRIVCIVEVDSFFMSHIACSRWRWRGVRQCGPDPQSQCHRWAPALPTTRAHQPQHPAHAACCPTHAAAKDAL